MTTSLNSTQCTLASGAKARHLLPLFIALLVIHTAPARTAEKSIPHVAPANCPVTKPYQSRGFVPPPGYPGPSTGHFYLGTDRLWTMFPIKGVLKGTTASGATHLELVWFRQGYNQWVEPTPRLKVHGKRLDGTARGVAVSQPKFIGSTPRNAMLVGLDIPDSGCWQITGRFEDEELAFVVWVTK